MLYTVQDTTMTALGDAVRSKVIGDIELYYNSGWMTRRYSDSQEMRQFSHTMNGVSKIKLTINIEGVYNNKFPMIYYGTGSVSTLNMTGLEKNETTFPYEIILDGNKASLYIETTPFTNPAIFCYELVGLDKNGNEFKYTPAEMVDVINGLNIPNIVPVVLTDNQYMGCVGQLAGEYINNFGNTITTKDITSCQNMFYNNSSVKKIPFDINCKQGTTIDMSQLFTGCRNLESAPAIKNAKPTSISSLFWQCPMINTIPNDLCDTWDWTYLDSRTGQWGGGSANAIFDSCYSLRSFPMELLKHGNPDVYTGYANVYNAFNGCQSLDEIVGLVFPQLNGTHTSNIFYSTFRETSRLKNMTFALQENGTPYTANWSGQTIDLSGFVGYANRNTIYITKYNSGITADKEVIDDATYQALKNDPDWYSIDINYSRYNHDSAVNTINSLPDTSAYGTNTISFKGQSGAKTDGGAINTLTEEEIAVASAKGWSVAFV